MASSTRSNLSEAVVSEAKPVEDFAAIKSKKFSRYIAHEITVPYPFEQVASLMSLERDFYPKVTIMASLVYSFGDKVPKKIEMGSGADAFVGQTFNCYKSGIPDEIPPGSVFKYVRVEYTQDKLHRTYMQDESKESKGSFTNFYNTVIATPSTEHPNATTIHYETGYTPVTWLPESMTRMFQVISHNDAETLKLMHCWIVTPLDAARRLHFREILLDEKTGNPTNSSGPCEYITTAKLGCSTEQVIQILQAADKQRVVENIITGSNYNKKSNTFSIFLEPIGEFIMYERSKPGTIASYTSSITGFKFSIDIKADAKQMQSKRMFFLLEQMEERRHLLL